MHPKGSIDAISVSTQNKRRQCGRGGRDEDRDDGDKMAGFMKVPQIQSVIPHLFDSGTVELRIAYLEFDHENYWAADYHRINATAHPRDAELHEDKAV